jgi:hypothetical protein
MNDRMPIEDPAIPDREGSLVSTGIYTGALLILIMMGALVAANRVPPLERYALERNGAAYGLFILVMLIPVVRHLGRPVHMFASAMVGWTLLVVAFDLAGMVFRDLFTALRTPFQVLVEGGLIYGVMAVGIWVTQMIWLIRRQSVATDRSGAEKEIHHRP